MPVTAAPEDHPGGASGDAGDLFAQTEGHAVRVSYTLRLEAPRSGVGSEPAEVSGIDLADCVGRTVRLAHDGTYACIRCGRRTDRTFGEGFCYPCFRDAPEAAECIVRPELCEAHLGRGRDPQWEEEHHNQPHVVYFAVSSALKVGVTRSTQIPTRWIDQGAAWAVAIARVPYRQLAGRIEVALKDLYTDRTSWQKMLKNADPPPFDLATELDHVRERIGAAGGRGDGDGGPLVEMIVSDAEADPIRLGYPILDHPTTVKAVNLQKVGEITGRLVGIRGQYLIFDGGAVLNVRRHSGFHVTVEV